MIELLLRKAVRRIDKRRAHKEEVEQLNQSLLESRFPAITCAPVHTTGEGLATQVRVGIENGLTHTSWVLCDQLSSLPRSRLTDYVGAVRGEQLSELHRALKVALELA